MMATGGCTKKILLRTACSSQAQHPLLLLQPQQQQLHQQRHMMMSSSSNSCLTLKPGSKLPSGLSIYKGQEPPVVLPTEEYPEWMNTISKSQKTLAHLRRMPNDDATLADIQRYLKLQRRNKIKTNNEKASV